MHFWWLESRSMWFTQFLDKVEKTFVWVIQYMCYILNTNVSVFVSKYWIV